MGRDESFWSQRARANARIKFSHSLTGQTFKWREEKMVYKMSLKGRQEMQYLKRAAADTPFSRANAKTTAAPNSLPPSHLRLALDMEVLDRDQMISKETQRCSFRFIHMRIGPQFHVIACIPISLITCLNSSFKNLRIYSNIWCNQRKSDVNLQFTSLIFYYFGSSHWIKNIQHFENSRAWLISTSNNFHSKRNKVMRQLKLEKKTRRRWRKENKEK